MAALGSAGTDGESACAGGATSIDPRALRFVDAVAEVGAIAFDCTEPLTHHFEQGGMSSVMESLRLRANLGELLAEVPAWGFLAIVRGHG